MESVRHVLFEVKALFVYASFFQLIIRQNSEFYSLDQ